MDMLPNKTPCYIIDSDIFSENLSAFRDVFTRYWDGNVSFGYSIKTNHAQVFLEMARNSGMYAEAVSDDECSSALAAGYEWDRIIYNGPQKSVKLLMELLAKECVINFDNETDLEALKEYVFLGMEVKAKIGLRVNFDLERSCPGETTAGAEVSRFGFCVENGDFASAVDALHLIGVPVSGLHMHYSTKTRSQRVFRQLAKIAAELIDKYKLHQEIAFVDIGGGFFYGKNVYAQGRPTLDAYAQVITEELKKILNSKKVELILEPGAALISTAVTYYAKIINQRFIRGVKVLTTDGSRLHVDPFMTGRNLLYQIICPESDEREQLPQQMICGSTCMENDRMVYLHDEKELKYGDLIQCNCVGAYTMGFNSCFINTPPYVYLKKGSNKYLVRDKNQNLLLQL